MNNSHEDTKARKGSRIERLLAELCPKGVRFRSLGDICVSVSAGGDLPENYEKGQLSPSANFPYPIYSNGSGEKALYGYTDAYKVETDAVTISARGTIGFHAVRKGKFTPIVRLISLIPDRNFITTEFLNYALDITDIGHSGGSIPQLTVPNVIGIRIPVPPLEIQREIVRVLDTFTALEAELEAELEARRRQYLYYRDALLRFDEEGDVRWATLGEAFHMRAGQFISADQIRKEPDHRYAYPCFGGNGIRGFVDVFTHDGAYLFIGRQGALCGNVQRTRGKFYATEHAVVVTPTAEVNVDWAFHKLTLMNLNQYASKSAQPGLAVGKLEGLPIPIPLLAEQARIVAILDQFDALVNDLTSGLPAEIKARRQQYEYYRDRLLTFREAA